MEDKFRLIITFVGVIRMYWNAGLDRSVIVVWLKVSQICFSLTVKKIQNTSIA